MSSSLSITPARKPIAPLVAFVLLVLGAVFLQNSVGSRQVLLLIVGAIIVRMVRDRRAGKGGCGCNCGGCPNAGACHPETAKK